MAVFPVVDVRRNVDGSWNVISTSDSITVPASSPYVVQLEEVPDNGSISGSAAPTISGLVITQNSPPTAGQFYVNFTTGQVEFNAAQAGDSYTVNYYAKGTLIQAYHINTLYTTKPDIQGTPVADYVATWVDADTLTATSELDFGTF